MTGARRIFGAFTIVATLGSVSTSPSPASPTPIDIAPQVEQNEPDLVDRILGVWSSMLVTVRYGLSGAPSLPRLLAVPGRATCIPTADGTVDCDVAAEFVCARNGFASGVSLDRATGRVCRDNPATAVSSPVDHDCKRKTWVTRVACW